MHRSPYLIFLVRMLHFYTLEVLFKNNEIRGYEIRGLLHKEMLHRPKNPAFFKNVKVETGGFALVWNDNFDISNV